MKRLAGMSVCYKLSYEEAPRANVRLISRQAAREWSHVMWVTCRLGLTPISFRLLLVKGQSATDVLGWIVTDDDVS